MQNISLMTHFFADQKITNQCAEDVFINKFGNLNLYFSIILVSKYYINFKVRP